MKGGLLILLGVVILAGTAGAYWWGQYSLLALFQFDLVGLKVLNFSFEQINLRIKLKAISKSNIEFQVSKLNVQLYVNGNYVGTASQDAVQNVPAMGYNFLFVDMLIQNSTFLMQLLNVAGSEPHTPIKIRTVGTCNIKSGVLSVSAPFDNSYDTTLYELLYGNI